MSHLFVYTKYNHLIHSKIQMQGFIYIYFHSLEYSYFVEGFPNVTTIHIFYLTQSVRVLLRLALRDGQCPNLLLSQHPKLLLHLLLRLRWRHQLFRRLLLRLGWCHQRQRRLWSKDLATKDKPSFRNFQSPNSHQLYPECKSLPQRLDFLTTSIFKFRKWLKLLWNRGRGFSIFGDSSQQLWNVLPFCFWWLPYLLALTLTPPKERRRANKSPKSILFFKLSVFAQLKSSIISFVVLATKEWITFS